MVFAKKIGGWVQKNHFKMQMNVNVKEWVGGSGHVTCTWTSTVIFFFKFFQ